MFIMSLIISKLSCVSVQSIDIYKGVCYLCALVFICTKFGNRDIKTGKRQYS